MCQSIRTGLVGVPGYGPPDPAGECRVPCLGADEAPADDSAVCSVAGDSCASDASSLLNEDLEGPAPSEECEEDVPQPSCPTTSLFLAEHGLRLATPVRLLGTGATCRVELVHIPLPHPLPLPPGLTPGADSSPAPSPPLPAARKTLPRSRDPHMRAREDAAFARELDCLAAGRGCPFVVRQLGAAVHEDRHELLLELAEGNTLEHELTAALDAVRGPATRPLLPPARLADIAASLLSALAHLHSAGVAHLDVKPANLLLTARGALLLGDAGCAQRAPSGPGGPLPGPFSGTPLFAAPEAKQQPARTSGGGGGAGRLPAAPPPPPVTDKADLYSVGVLLAVCAAWHRQTGRVLALLRGQAALPEYVPEGLRELVGRLLAEDPAARPSAAEALRHPFLAGVGLAALAPVRCEGAAPR